LSDHGHGAVPVDDVGGSLRDAAGYLDRQTVEDPSPNKAHAHRGIERMFVEADP